MTTRDAYVALLEKRATSESDVVSEPTRSIDNAQQADQEHNRNQEDHRSYLHSIFSNAEAVQNNQSSEVRKLFSSIPNGTTTSNPLLKVAGSYHAMRGEAREPFFAALEVHGGFMKTASSIHREVAFNAFCDELHKIASAKGWISA